MKLKEIYNLINDNEFLEIKKNGKTYVLESIYNYLEGYHIFEKEKTILIDDFETFKINDKLLIDSEVLKIGCYAILDSSELHIENMILIIVG